MGFTSEEACWVCIKTTNKLAPPWSSGNLFTFFNFIQITANFKVVLLSQIKFSVAFTFFTGIDLSYWSNN